MEKKLKTLSQNISSFRLIQLGEAFVQMLITLDSLLTKLWLSQDTKAKRYFTITLKHPLKQKPYKLLSIVFLIKIKKSNPKLSLIFYTPNGAGFKDGAAFSSPLKSQESRF